MAGVLAARPTYFESVQDAISWCGRTGVCRSKEAASVSLPSQLMRQDLEGPPPSCPPATPTAAAAARGLGVGEGQQQQGNGSEGSGGGVDGRLIGQERWVWRTPLEKSQQYWEGWYRGLSEEFLKVWISVREASMEGC